MKQHSVAAPSYAKSASVAAVVIRCGCTEEQKRSATFHAYNVEPERRVCPNPRIIENKGTVSYWHSSPVKRFLYSLAKFLRLPVKLEGM